MWIWKLILAALICVTLGLVALAVGVGVALSRYRAPMWMAILPYGKNASIIISHLIVIGEVVMVVGFAQLALFTIDALKKRAQD